LDRARVLVEKKARTKRVRGAYQPVVARELVDERIPDERTVELERSVEHPVGLGGQPEQRDLDVVSGVVLELDGERGSSRARVCSIRARGWRRGPE
jgi:hypothetical protein